LRLVHRIDERAGVGDDGELAGGEECLQAGTIRVESVIVPVAVPRACVMGSKDDCASARFWRMAA